jgi:tetratricopeptide (TPR) repeat protein
MQRKLRLDEFDSKVPQPQWLNQLRVTIAIGKRYEQKGDMEKALKCYETVLYYTPNDTITRVKLSKCHQKMLQLEQAVSQQNQAMLHDPLVFQTIENEASLYFELGNFEKSLIAYNTLSKQFKTSNDCQRGFMKVNKPTYSY